MINYILDFSLRQRAIILLGTFALLVGGIWSAVNLPIDAVPDITGVQVQINTEIPALAAEESEKLRLELLGTTRERMMRELCDAVETLSTSRPLLLILEDGMLVFLDGRLVGEDAGHVGGEFVELRLVGQDGFLVGDDHRLVGQHFRQFALVVEDRLLVAQDFTLVGNHFVCHRFVLPKR